MWKDVTRCVLCEYYDECEYAEQINFCEDCVDRHTCGLRNVQCLAGHDIECNNGFEASPEIDWEDEWEEADEM